MTYPRPKEPGSSDSVVRESPIEGCFEIVPPAQSDERGSLAKIYDQEIRRSLPGDVKWREVFWTLSERNVIRGMHFQAPPKAVDKLVFCAAGDVFDVVVDLRDGPNFGSTFSCILDSRAGNAIFVPAGCAHGFAVISNEASVCYLQSGSYDSLADEGIRWTSVNVAWPIKEHHAVVSDRDRNHPLLESFVTPFDAPSGSQ